MDYKRIAKYTKKFKIPDNSSTFFMEFDDHIEEYDFFSTKSVYYSGKKSIISYKQGEFDFVVYKKKLEIFVNGKLHKTFKGDEVIDLNGVFYVKTKNLSFVVNEKGQTAFASINDRLIYFTENGTIFYTNSVCENNAESIGHEIKNKLSLKPAENSNLMIRKFPSKFYEGILVKDYLGNKTIYDKNSDPIIVVDKCIKLYAGPIKVEGILCISHIKIENTIFMVILTEKALFLMYKDFTVKYDVSGFIGIVESRYSIFNFQKEFCFSELFSYFLFFDAKIFSKNSLIFKSHKVFSSLKAKFVDVSFKTERIFCKVLVENRRNKLQSNFDSQRLIFNFVHNVPPLILCKAYRFIDDKGKMEILNFINFDQLDAEGLFLMLHFHPEYSKVFVNRCIEEKKIYLIKDYLESLEKINRSEELKKLLLEKEILIEEQKLPNLSKFQKEEIESQRIFHSKFN